MKKNFQNTDEINEYLLKDTTPFEYCKQVITDMLAEIREYLTGINCCKKFKPEDFFSNRQCDVFLKNRTRAEFTMETPLEALLLFDPEDIEYVHFSDSIPIMIMQKDAHLYFEDEDDLRFSAFPSCCDLSTYLQSKDGCAFDSIRGAFLRDEEYGKSIYENSYYRTDHRYPFRIYPEYSAHDVNFTYFANATDGYIGAVIAEQILLSNLPESCSLLYGKQDYESLVADAPIPDESRTPIGDPAFMKEANDWRKALFVKLKADLGKAFSRYNPSERTAFSLLCYVYIHSLLRTAAAENFTIIDAVFTDHLKKEGKGFLDEPEAMLQEVETVCHTDYFCKPQYTETGTLFRYFQYAVWAVVNSNSYLKAISNILTLTAFSHDTKLAVILTGIFAGIYYQHYRIPQEYLTNNRYYGKFSAAIIPFDHKVYRKYASFTQDEKNSYL